MRIIDLLFTRMRDKHTRTIINFAIILVVTFFVFRNFLLSADWPAGGDIMGYISREYLYAKDYRWMYTWRSNSFGYTEGVNLMDFFFMTLHFLIGSAPTTAKIFAISTFALAGLGMHLFCYHTSKRHLPALAGALTYILNQVYLTQLTEAHLDIMLSYAIAPLIFLFLDKTLETGKVKHIVATSVLVCVMLTSFHPQMIVIYGIFLILYLIFGLASRRDSVPSITLKRNIRSICTIALIAVPLSALMWVPFLFDVRAPYLSSAFSRGNLEDTYAHGYQTLQEAFALGAKEMWGYGNIIDVTKDAGFPLLPVETILLLAFSLAYGVTLLFRLDRYSVFFGLSALISILISMGPYSPFDQSFFWAWINIPYFMTFRAISRWALFTALANSFFVCSSASIVIGYIQKTSCALRKNNVEDQANALADSPTSRHLSWLPDVSRSIDSLRRLPYYLAILFLITILSSGFLSTWYLFSNGLQTYTPPRSYIEPYKYFLEVPGEYKIVNVGRSGGDWLSASSVDPDFMGGSMLTSVGWTHDLGYESAFIHDKPVLQDGGLSGPSTDFVSYLRFLAKNNLTRDMLRILGDYDYRYVVVPSYVTDSVRSFVLSQHGGEVVLNESESLILENQFHTPRVFGTSELGLVFGGPQALLSLCTIDSFTLNRTSLVSAVQTYGSQDAGLEDLIDDSSIVVLSDSNILDLVIRQSPSMFIIHAADYGVTSYNATRFWIKNDYWTNRGENVLGQRVLTTSGNLGVNIPFEASSDGEYEVFLRIAYAPNRGKLVASIDGLPIAEIKPYSGLPGGLRWVNLTESDLSLEAGQHVITLQNDGSGFNDIDALAIVEKTRLQENQEKIQGLFPDYSGNILCLMEAEKAFSDASPSGWFASPYQGEGYALHVEGGMNIGSLGQASASSNENSLIAKLAFDDDSLTRWASSVGLPQWIEITWPVVEEVNGLTIAFQEAYARDYSVMTWNGSSWVNQLVVENNTMLHRTHSFAQPIMTNKIRVVITSAPSYNMVSIYEMEVLSTGNMTSSEIYVPKSGNYKFTARLAPEDESNSTFFLKVDNQSLSLSISSSNQSDFTWRDLGTVFLQAGEHRIAVGSVGPVTLDKLAAHLIDNGKQTIEDLFRTQASSPSVQFEKINPCRYIAHVNTTTPFLLTFSESYHPMWKAYVEGQEISPIATNFIVNGYQMNKAGSYDVELYFVGQEFADAGLLISGTTVIVLIIAFPLRNRLFRKLKQILLVLRRSRKQSPLLLTEKAVSLCQNITNPFCYLKSQQHCLESVTP